MTVKSNPQVKKKPLTTGFIAYLPLSVLLALSGCATMGAPPVAPCNAWLAAESAWVATDAIVRQQLAQQRALACLPPPTPPHAGPDMPAEPTPPQSRAPPEQVPLTTYCRRED